MFKNRILPVIERIVISYLILCMISATTILAGWGANAVYGVAVAARLSHSSPNEFPANYRLKDLA
jgi:hypothetical protein